jgi:carbon starvation protein
VTVLLILLISITILVLGGHLYSTFLARSWGEQPDRITPAVRLNDGHDYVPTPTPVVFAHHFASIAGAGPIIGPVIAVCYGWLPAVLWVVFGGMLIGAVHDYLATFMSTFSTSG